MSETKFTPGPWTARPRRTGDGSWWVEAQKDGTPWYLAECAGRQSKNEANAHLIAAAPDLYNALTETRDASAHMMRFIADNLSTAVMLRLAESMEQAGFAGYGVRAQAALAKATP